MSKHKEMVNFRRGVPPVEAFPVQQLQECASAILEREGDVVLQYHPAAGYTPLRGWLAERHGAAPGSVFVSNGSLQIQEFLARHLASPGDTVLVERPSYDRAITILRRRGLRVLGVPLQPDGFDVAALEELLKEERPRLFYIIPDFQNPSGITTSRAKREQLVALAEKYDFYILEDNPYRELRYRGEPLPSIFAFDSDKVLFLSSFSKLLSPGIRVGYLIGPTDLIDEIAQIAEDTYVTPSMLSQGAVYEYCRRGWLDPNIERLKNLYRPRLKVLLSALEEHLPQAEWSEPEGGFFVAVNLPQGVDTPALRTRAQEVGLQLSDGRGFFPESGGDSFLRLPFCALTEREIKEGVSRLGAIVRRRGA